MGLGDASELCGASSIKVPEYDGCYQDEASNGKFLFAVVTVVWSRSVPQLLEK